MHRKVLIACLGLTGAANANVIVNGDFEAMPNWNAGIAGDGSYTLLTGGAIPGWTVAANHGATIHNTGAYPFISGNYSLNTDGEGWNGHNVDIFQDFASVNGQAYALTFDWKNWYFDSTPRLDVSVVDTVTSVVLAHGNYGQLAGTHSELFTFTGSGNALRLRVMHSPESTYNDNAFIVDNFAVELVPAPGAASLLGAAVLARRRRR
ncbi:MAG: DUF642 domain-containing protein [Phycisphaerales bacterium]